MEIQLTAESKSFLMSAATWAKFLGIMGFVFIGLFVLLAFYLGGVFSSMPGTAEIGEIATMSGGFLTTAYLIIALIYFFPSFFMYRFGKKTKAALEAYDSIGLTEGLANLKSTFKFMGILVIILLALYLLGFLTFIFAGATAFI